MELIGLWSGRKESENYVFSWVSRKTMGASDRLLCLDFIYFGACYATSCTNIPGDLMKFLYTFPMLDISLISCNPIFLFSFPVLHPPMLKVVLISVKVCSVSSKRCPRGSSSNSRQEVLKASPSNGHRYTCT
jgi:hypothetical protein